VIAVSIANKVNARLAKLWFGFVIKPIQTKPVGKSITPCGDLPARTALTLSAALMAHIYRGENGLASCGRKS
jgi:hypothetical protein